MVGASGTAGWALSFKFATAAMIVRHLVARGFRRPWGMLSRTERAAWTTSSQSMACGEEGRRRRAIRGRNVAGMMKWLEVRRWIARRCQFGKARRQGAASDLTRGGGTHRAYQSSVTQRGAVDVKRCTERITSAAQSTQRDQQCSSSGETGPAASETLRKVCRRTTIRRLSSRHASLWRAKSKKAGWLERKKGGSEVWNASTSR